MTADKSPAPVSTRDDVRYPLLVQFRFLPSRAMQRAANQNGHLLQLPSPVRERHVVTSPQARAELYLSILRREHGRGRFDVQTPLHAAARAYEIERDAYLAQVNLARGGNVHARYKNQPGFVRHKFRSEFELRFIRYDLALYELLATNIDNPDAVLLREKPKYQIVNQFYGTLAEHLLVRRHFSCTVLKDAALQVI